jgi:hypothetical protein
MLLLPFHQHCILVPLHHKTTGTTEQNLQKIKVQLLVDCEDKDAVQIRWISRKHQARVDPHCNRQY